MMVNHLAILACLFQYQNASFVLSSSSLSYSGDHSTIGDAHANPDITKCPGFANSYDLGGKIAEGATGKVYECTRRVDTYHFAVKFINTVDGESSRKKAAHEMAIVQKLPVSRSLSHVVEYIECEWGLAVVQTRYGPSLASVLNFNKIQGTSKTSGRITVDHDFDEYRVASLLGQMLVGIRDLAGEKIFHGDVKPDNLVFSTLPSNKNAFLIFVDYDAARDYSEPVVESEPMGTPLYMAPEVIRGEGRSVASDMWSVGIIGYLMLFGQHPLPGLEETPMMYALGKYVKLSQFRWDVVAPGWPFPSEGAVRFMKGLLAPLPADRPSPEAALQDPWMTQAVRRSSLSSPFNVMSSPPSKTSRSSFSDPSDERSLRSHFDPNASGSRSPLSMKPEEGQSPLTPIFPPPPNTNDAPLEQLGAFEDAYKLGVLLGQGTTGQVFACMPLVDRRIAPGSLAVKIVPRVGSSAPVEDEAVTGRVRREVAILRALSHRHIVRLDEVFEEEGAYFLVMERLGASLAQRLALDCIKDPSPDCRLARARIEEYEGAHPSLMPPPIGVRVTEKQAVRWLGQALQAVAYLHEAGVVYGDLKLDNLMVREAGSDIVLVDFESAQILSDGPPRECRGTLHWMAPEVLACSPSDVAGPARDLWSIGVLASVLLCGQYPFPARNHEALVSEITNSKPSCTSPLGWAAPSAEAMDFISKLYDEMLALISMPMLG